MTGSDDGSRFSTRLGLILSVLGIAVGTGNIWRFPRIAATNSGSSGAGAFLVAWVVFLLIWSIPLIIAEYALGQRSRMGVVGTFAKIAGKKFTWMGAFVGMVATAIMFYYSVVAGWAVYYFVQMLFKPLPLSTQAATQIWNSFQAGGWPVFFHLLAMTLGVAIVLKGVSSIEKANKFLIPTLFLIILFAVGYTLTLNGSWEGIKFLFTPDWSLLAKPHVWIDALTQNAWDTGAGWGLILTYGAYMQRKHGIFQNAFITGIGNNLVSLLAAIIIFGTVFAVLGAQMPQGQVLKVMQTSGPASTGLTFIWMPQLFAKMPIGNVFAVLFFLGLSFAAFSSLISMIELASRVLVDLGISRTQATISVGIVGFLLGLPSAIWTEFLANQDFVWGVGLLISGGLVSFAVIQYGPQKLRLGFLPDVSDGETGKTWDVLIGKVVPIQAVVLLIWWLSTVYDPQDWYHPFEFSTLSNFLLQWGGVIVLFLVLNRWLANKSLDFSEVAESVTD
ncbi:MAG TPA: sodium-dependent transporter [Balneolaceae bacterium]|nr:sodium-dependent transporter [Balneolaceae bacterium]